MKLVVIFIVLIMGTCFTSPAYSQSWDEWFRQRKTQRKYLVQQIAKLQIYLGYVKKGYDIAQQGLSLIGDIKSGDLTLHSLFFDHLGQVSPAVRNYSKVTQSIRLYTQMLKGRQSAIIRFKEAGGLSNKEMEYLDIVFFNIIDQVSGDIDNLVDVLTNYRLQMSDEERIERIIQIHKAITEKHTDLFSFINRFDVLIHGRKMQLNDLQTLQNWHQP